MNKNGTSAARTANGTCRVTRGAAVPEAPETTLRLLADIERKLTETRRLRDRARELSRRPMDTSGTRR